MLHRSFFSFLELLFRWGDDYGAATARHAHAAQVATHSAVLLFDMPKLKGSQALDRCLSSLLQNAGIIKLGCRLLDDVTKLYRSYPDMQAFREAQGLLDLTGPWTMYMQENQDQVWLRAEFPDMPCLSSIIY